MKTKKTSINFKSMAGTAALVAFALLSLAPISQAKDKGKGNNGRGNGKDNHGERGREESHGNPHHDHDQQAYYVHPTSKFKLNKGNGHAGQGYYYGPPNMPYYYARPGVSYYPNQRAIPPQFRNQDVYRMNSDDYRVQQALARLGYYQGPMDGQFGPQSYRALNNYQRSQGMPISNAITAVLLRALGLQ
jgi:hypothetical protein